MNTEEQFYIDQLKLMQRVRDALLGLGEFGTDRSSQDLLFFNTEMMLTCELLFEDVSELESTKICLRCRTQVGDYELVGGFNQNSSDADLQKFSRELFKAAVRVQEDAAVAQKLCEIRRTLGMEN